MRVVVLLCAVSLVACPYTDKPPAPPQPDASDSGAPTCASMCANLSAMGCPEGAAGCDATCRHVQVTRLTDLPIACLSAARSKPEARACGSLACP